MSGEPWRLGAARGVSQGAEEAAEEDGGWWRRASQQRQREVAEREARRAEQTGDAYSKLLADGARYASKEDWRKSAKACREAIALRPDQPGAYYNLGVALGSAGHNVEAAQRYLEAKERALMGSGDWAVATASAFDKFRLPECAEVAKPEWWNDEGLKALSARVVRAAPDDAAAHQMRALVLYRQSGAWEMGPRSAAELMEAATHFERVAVLCPAPAGKAHFARMAMLSRSEAGRHN